MQAGGHYVTRNTSNASSFNVHNVYTGTVCAVWNLHKSHIISMALGFYTLQPLQNKDHAHNAKSNAYPQWVYMMVVATIWALNLVLGSRLLVRNMHPALSLHLSTSYVHIRTQKKEEI
jgi:hypothetical protein